MVANDLLRRLNEEQARLRDNTSLLARERETLARSNENCARLAQLTLQTLEAYIVQLAENRERENTLQQENNSLSGRIREVEWLNENLQHEYIIGTAISGLQRKFSFNKVRLCCRAYNC